MSSSSSSLFVASPLNTESSLRNTSQFVSNVVKDCSPRIRMFVQLPVGSIFATGCGGVGGGLLGLPCLSQLRSPRPRRFGLIRLPVVMALGGHAQGGIDDHYTVLGVSRCATYDDIKKAYRLLARKWHPDVNKDSQADEVFKTVRLAYEVLSNEAKRTQYDRELSAREGFIGSTSRSSNYNSHPDHAPDLEYVLRIYRWSGLSRKKQKERYWNKYKNSSNSSFFYADADDEFANKTSFEKRGSFTQVLESAFISLFLMQTIGCRLSLTFSSMIALFDEKLDGGYKLAYMMAWILGGKGGILLSLFLSFAIWAFGKTSSGTVAVVLVAMWIGSSLATYCPIPRGAVLALMYMSIKLQADLN